MRKPMSLARATLAACLLLLSWQVTAVELPKGTSGAGRTRGAAAGVEQHRR